MRIYLKYPGSQFYSHITTLSIANVFSEYRFASLPSPYYSGDVEYSKALSHLEEIINGFSSEDGALLYLNDSNDLASLLANVIIKRGRKDLLLTYVPADLSNQGYYALGPDYPNPDRKQAINIPRWMVE